MLTTCPECRTTFRLSNAQLEARRGLVRCGYCRAVFNAYDTLLPEFETPSAPATPEPEIEAAALETLPEPHGEPAASADQPVLVEPEAAVPAEAYAEIADELGQPEEVLPVEPVADQAEAAYPGLAEAGKETFGPGAPEDEAFVLHLSDRVGQELPQFDPPPVMPFTPAMSFPESPDTILLSELPTRTEIEPERGTGKKILFSLLSVLLVLVLLGQVAYFLRGALVAWMPELRPGLEAACDELGCRIPLASDLAAIRIESSSLETDPEQANRAVLRVSFSNRSRATQRWPHFVLKLTDWKGGPLAQRAFSAADYLPKDKAALAGMAPMSEQEFRLDLDMGGLSASGYEVFPKYP